MSELKNLEVKLRYLERTFTEIQKLRVSAENRIGSYVRNGYTDEKTANEMHHWVDDILMDTEKKIGKQIEEVVIQHPLWHEWFNRVRGVGKLLAGQLMGEINIEKTPHPSALWAYAGLATKRWCPICGYETMVEK